MASERKEYRFGNSVDKSFATTLRVKYFKLVAIPGRKVGLDQDTCINFDVGKSV